MMRLLELLNNPPREYTPIPFWFLNGDLRREEIKRQLRDFCDHGVYGVVLHPRIGLPPRISYLSESFFGYLRVAIDTAAELDMRVVLYDEGMYPSGSASGLVVRDHPELASRGLCRAETPAPGDTVLCPVAGGYLVERFSGGRLRGLHYGEDDGEPNQPLSADILNPEAVNRFIQLTHEAYYQHFAPHFGKTIIGFFTDEPSILGRNVRDMQPWTRGFADMFCQAGGNLAGLAGLFDGTENADTALYRRLMLERESEVYYASLSRWCQAHGIALMGHPHQSDDIEFERHFHVPGQDLVFRWVSPETGGTVGMDSTMGKCSADMARHMGARRNSNECFGACNRGGNPWYFTGEDMKWFIDWLAVRGVNLFIPHAFYYSLTGKRSAERPPDVGPGSIWWPHYQLWAGYMTRLSCLMAETEYQADIALLCRNRELHAEAAAPLFEGQRAFEYLPESLWADCREENGRLICGSRSYGAVVGADTLFPTVSHDPQTVAPDCLCDPAQPDLRIAALKYQGQPCWLLVNEGENDLQAQITLPVHEPLGQYDLWQNTACALPGRNTEQGMQFRLSLPRRGSLLVFAAGEALPQPESLPVLENIPFTLIGQDPKACTKTYAATLPAYDTDVIVSVNAEEMAELFVNGQPCGVAFWAPQRFRIPHALTGGQEAELRLVITGSLANRYGNQPVPYGLI